MKRNKILSSAFVMTMVSFGAFAADGTITGGAGTCTVEVLGVHENDSTANTIATWTLNKYTLVPGKRLSVTDTDVETVDCDSGSYCPGGEYTVETASEATKSCPADFPNSETGAGADTQCYTACTVDMVAKATAVTGNDYYGSGVDTCEPTACMAGWHVKAGLDIGATIGEEAGTNSARIDNSGSFAEADFGGGTKGQEYYGISDKNSFAVDYEGKGLLTGHGRCSTQTGDNNNYTWTDPTIVNTLTDETGQNGAHYCYCQVDGFTPMGGDKVIVTSAPWVFDRNYASISACKSVCTANCARFLRSDGASDLAFRAAVMNSLPALPVTPATCAANTINIKWDPANDGTVIENQCTYNDAITLPSDPVKPGYTFTGWKLKSDQ